MKYHVEAKDNAKFLGSIEKASHCIYLQVSRSERSTIARLETFNIHQKRETSKFSGP